MAKDRSKSVLMVVAHNNFRDEEYSAARQNLEANHAKITVGSTVKSGALGSQGMSINPDLLIDDVNPNDYDAVVFIGGTGSSQYWHDSKAHEIATTLARENKLIAASSHAPVILAVAGLLNGKKATGHITVYEKLKVAGAIYTGSKLERDGNIITCTGPNAAKQFGKVLGEAINETFETTSA